MDRNQAEEMRRAADRFAEAARELSRSVDRLAEHEEAMAQVYRFWASLGEALHEEGGTLRVRPVVPYRVGLPEKEAASLAVEAVREVRRDLWRGREPEAPEPSPEEIEEWELHREERRRDTGYEPR
jgi:hypothetical protein